MAAVRNAQRHTLNMAIADLQTTNKREELGRGCDSNRQPIVSNRYNAFQPILLPPEPALPSTPPPPPLHLYSPPPANLRCATLMHRDTRMTAGRHLTSDAPLRGSTANLVAGTRNSHGRLDYEWTTPAVAPLPPAPPPRPLAPRRDRQECRSPDVAAFFCESLGVEMAMGGWALDYLAP